MLATVALAAVVLWLAVPAIRFRRDAKHNRHIHSTSRPGEPFVPDQLHATPFWPWYWRRVLGRPWPGSYRCLDTARGDEVSFMDERR